METTPNLNLTLWNDITDEYSNSQLSANFQNIDVHSHIPSQGGGVQIQTGAIASNAIVNSLIQPGAIQGHAGASPNIQTGSINGQDIAAGALTSASFSPSVAYGFVPLGTIIPWYRPNTSFSLPQNWVYADGSTYNPGSHGWGNITITVPDLQNNFILGAIPGSPPQDNGPSLPPTELASGGSNTQNLTHVHTVPPFQVQIPHSHTVGDHTHLIISDGLHSHSIQGLNLYAYENVFQPNNLEFYDINGNVRHANQQSASIGGSSTTYLQGPMPIDSNGYHDHTGATGGAAPGTTTDYSYSSPISLTTNSQASSPTDFRVNWVGLLFLCKIN